MTRKFGIKLFKGVKTIVRNDRQIYFFKKDLRVISFKNFVAIEGDGKIKNIEEANDFIRLFGMAWSDHKKRNANDRLA